jgi:hypothetical protein
MESNLEHNDSCEHTEENKVEKQEENITTFQLGGENHPVHEDDEVRFGEIFYFILLN